MGHMAALGHGVEQLIAGVLGLGRHKADQVVAVDLVQLPQQVRKVPGLRQILAVGVDVLAQQGDLLIPLRRQLADLLHDLLRGAAALPAPDVGDDAVRAEVVAPIHDGHPRPNPALPDHGHALGNGAVLVLHGEHPAPAGIHPVQQLRELPQGLGPEHQVHMAIALPDLPGHLRPLGHAAAQADDLLRVRLFRVGQGAQGAVNPLFRMVPDGACIHDHNVRPGRIVGEIAPHIPQHPQNMLAVGHVLLAAEGVHHRQRRPAPGPVDIVYFLGKLPLAGHLPVVEKNLLSVQWKPPSRPFS